nr:MAG TPA_asm: hypothetical protein [Caudoviricetes sp.]
MNFMEYPYIYRVSHILHSAKNWRTLSVYSFG